MGNTADKVEIVASWLRGSDIEDAMKIVLVHEQKCEQAKRDLSVAKKELAKAMRD